jgi:hypothetical protein
MGVSKGVDEPFNYAFPVSISPRGAPIEGAKSRYISMVYKDFLNS